jgi:hypothetical protein
MKTATVLLALLTAIPALTLAFAPAPFYRPAKVKHVEVAKNITLEVEGNKAQKRRVIVAATVCLREGLLEQLLTRKGTKEYEAVLAADVDAREVHKALLLAGAIPGAPARLDGNFKPATGHTIRIALEWKGKDGPRRADARQWVRDIKSRKPMAHDWVFAGSQLIPDPQRQDRPRYLANEGDVICVANFEEALLDLPVKSSKSSEELAFEAFTENIPPLGTEVRLILEPAPARN